MQYKHQLSITCYSNHKPHHDSYCHNICTNIFARINYCTLGVPLRNVPPCFPGSLDPQCHHHEACRKFPRDQRCQRLETCRMLTRGQDCTREICNVAPFSQECKGNIRQKPSKAPQLMKVFICQDSQVFKN